MSLLVVVRARTDERCACGGYRHRWEGSIPGLMPDERHPGRSENLEGWGAMSDSLSRQVAEAFATVTDEDRQALRALDGFEADRIEARRRYEEFVDLPTAPGPLPAA
jgi:hypothetical protein